MEYIIVVLLWRATYKQDYTLSRVPDLVCLQLLCVKIYTLWNPGNLVHIKNGRMLFVAYLGGTTEQLL